MKRKFVAPLIALLLCVSMIGVGFAGWVITATTEATAQGNFTVYPVSDYRLKFTATATNVIYGKPSNNAADSSNWLTYDNDEVALQDLQPTITLTLTDFDLTKFKGKTLTFTVGEIAYNDNTNISNAVDGYCIALNASNSVKQAVTLTVDSTGSSADASVGATYTAATQDTPATLTFELTTGYFDWGVATNKQNPYTFFAGTDVDGEFAQTWDATNKFAAQISNGDAALQILQNINAITDSDKFSTTITCTIS